MNCGLNKEIVVSIILPTYNRSSVIKRSINSVLGQSFHKLELIVVNDGSTDNTDDIIKKMSQFDDRIQYIKFNTNKGPQKARNTGIHAAKGDYIALLDSDDEWEPNFIEEALSIFQKGSSKLGVVYSHVGIFDEKGNITKFINSSVKGDIYQFLLKTCSLAPTSALLIKRVCFNKCGLFNPNLVSCQDDDICMKIAKHFEFDFINKPLVLMHLDASNRVSGDFNRIAEGFNTLVGIYKNDIINALGKNELANKYVKLARYYIRANNFQESKRAYAQSLIIYPNNIFRTIKILTKIFVPYSVLVITLSKIRAVKAHLKG